ncbi:MAG: acyl carrier protein [bacterium]|nr:acyl carrier protein [bacterium]
MAEFEKQDTSNKVITLIAEKLNVARDAVKLNSNLQDLGADSLAMVEVIMKLEEDLDIQIDDEKAEHLKSVEDVVDYVHSLRNK